MNITDIWRDRSALSLDHRIVMLAECDKQTPERVMKSNFRLRLIFIIVAVAVTAMAPAASASPLKARACPGAVMLEGDNILINRPPPYSICNPSA